MPTNIVPLSNLAGQTARLQFEMKSAIETIRLWRTAYSSICLDLAQSLNQKYPEQWSKALKALNHYSKIVQVLFFHSPFPAGDQLRRKAIAAGLKKAERKLKI